MSEFKQPPPFLRISTIEGLRSNILLSCAGEGWALGNRAHDDDVNQKLMAMFIMGRKAEFQLDCIINNVNKLYELLTDFSEGNFQKYIELWDDSDGQVFEPYAVLESRLQTDCYDSLPDKIERFNELLWYSKASSVMQEVENETINAMFGAIEKHYTGVDADGNEILIPESQIPDDVLADLKYRKEVKQQEICIEQEFALDAYNDWLSAMTGFVVARRPFKEMLTLFRD